MNHQRRERSAVTARRERVYRLWCQGWSVARLAQQEGVHHSQICRDLAARREFIKRHDADAAQRDLLERERAIGTYQEIILEAFQEWERSKEDKGRRKQQQTTGPAGTATASAAAKVVSEVVSEGRLGDPQYLRTVIEARKRIDKLAGIDVDVLLLQCAELAEKVKEKLRGLGHEI